MTIQAVNKILGSIDNTQIDIPQKRSYSLDITLTDSAGAPIDITGWTFNGAIYDAQNQTDQTPFTIVVNADPLTGNFTASLSVAEVDTLDLLNKYRYEIISVDTTASTNDVLVGPVCLLERGVV